MAQLEAAGVADESLALGAGAADPRRDGRFQAALVILAESDPLGHERRTQEVVFLANIIEGGFGTSEKPIRTADALHAVFGICDRGLEWLDEHPTAAAEERNDLSVLKETSPVILFKLGWRNMSQFGSVNSIDELLSALAPRST